ncbi:YpfB family protein [Caldibacillus lycopersici]|uniref:YpfB family protein n=1 Tax=Perspicuibacillus lycopersici TaxID=1325689 RepID=A0AAE3IVM7_9BACI|nr:YpfB family protein [Perspicuibacillus lycopersici]MCU9613724.1 YpfB family protein [Perspicuibacillus lycopersici]
MKRIERIIIKLVVIQAIFLFLCQIIFHHLNTFPELKDLTQYEGVNEENFSKVLETINSP